ncbi:MAG: hypothetical protein QOE14_917, partial [Humisphaera sp.]|nr:hypothetical protein [Humisphaera sp.]
DNSGEDNLVYSWEAIDEQALSVTFSSNGTNAAKNTTATFTRTGTYQLRVTISDGLSATQSTVVVTVNQLLTSIVVTPSGTPVANGESRQLDALAKDQFAIEMVTQPSFVWGVDNSFGTVTQSGLYTSPATGLGTATVRATASDSSISGTATVITQSPKPADNPANLVPLIDYSYYEGTFTTLPNFDALTPVKTGLISNVTFAPRLRTDNFAFQYTGYVYVPASGTYTFYTTSDDGSKLWIGGQQVVDNDGTHSSRERSGSIILDVGWHAWKLGYFDATGSSDVISASFSGPGIATKQLIPDANLKRADRAPTIATLPSANPNPVIGKTADLSVVGNDESGEAVLTYTWSTAAGPSGAPAPIFSANGTNASKQATVTFGRAGTYTLQVSISDGVLATTSTVNVIVDQTVTTITLAPASATVKQNRTQQFTATASDQFGNTVANPTLAWSVPPNGGSITSSGLYTAPETLGSYLVTASAGSANGSATATIVEDQAPTVVTPASASPNPTNGAQTQLSVLGGDDGGEANLTYTWAATAIPAGAAAPSFSANGTNAAKSVSASLSAPGTYTFRVTISDGVGSTTSSVDVSQSSGAPMVATAAAATPAPVNAASTALSVLGADSQVGESGLTYTWSTLGTPPAPVTFSANGTNAAKNSTASFTRAGAYSFRVLISNGSATTTSTVNVTVNQTITSVAVTPSTAIVIQGATRQFSASALDQFGIAMASQPSFTWATGGNAGGGTISSSGLYTAPSSGTPTHTVVATASGTSVSGSANVTVTPASPTDVFTTSQDIGAPALAGSWSKSGNTYTVRGGGADIWGTSDQFHYLYRPLVGNGEIIAHVASVQNTNGLAKAGVMLRETLAADSKHVNLSVGPDGWTRMVSRLTTAGSSTSQSLSGAAAPYWIKLVRAGNTITGYRSPIGVDWTTVGVTTIPTMASNIYVGIAVCARDNTKLNTSTFDNVNITGASALAGAAMVSSAARSATTAATATVDGSLSTYFESSSADDAWVGVDFGSAKTITGIQFAPRKGYQGRMIGGRFQASNTADFSGAVTDLFVITRAPRSGAITAQTISPGQAFRYVRYLAPDGSFGNIAETSFIGF